MKCKFIQGLETVNEGEGLRKPWSCWTVFYNNYSWWTSHHLMEIPASSASKKILYFIFLTFLAKLETKMETQLLICVLETSSRVPGLQEEELQMKRERWTRLGAAVGRERTHTPQNCWRNLSCKIDGASFWLAPALIADALWYLPVHFRASSFLKRLPTSWQEPIRAWNFSAAL